MFLKSSNFCDRPSVFLPSNLLYASKVFSTLIDLKKLRSTAVVIILTRTAGIEMLVDMARPD
jgi:hypothetical protein